MRALLLDIGGVLIRTPFELLGAAERTHDLQLGQLGPRGPFGAPGSDPAFDEVVAGRRSERDYWADRARHASPLLGIEPTTDALMHALFALPREEIVRPEAAALATAAARADVPLAVLTNDLHDFHGTGWFHDLGVVDPRVPIVDGSLTGHLKPAPQAYELALDALRVPAATVVYLDDQPVNVRGGRTVGLHAIELDPRRPEIALAQAREVLALP